MPNTRKADYHLGCLEGSIYLDLNLSTRNHIYLTRISFDGFGCCNLKDNTKKLALNDSNKFISKLSQDELDQEVIGKLVMKLIELNQEQIWKDALFKYNLIS